MKTKFSLLALLLTLMLLFPTPARADGIIIPHPPICDPCPPPPCPGPLPCPVPSPIMQLVIRYHRVTVTIQDQVAVTEGVVVEDQRFVFNGSHALIVSEQPR